jgi:hypothetical protein
MKKSTTIILTFTLSALSLFTSEVYGQQRYELRTTEHEGMDSLQDAREQVKVQKEKDEDRMAIVKNERRETKAIAKEAQRVNREANDAARESNNALRAEKKAQAARKHADRQAQRAARARDKSDEN